MDNNPPRVLGVETNHSRNPRRCTTPGPEISKGRVLIDRGWIQCQYSNDINNSRRGHLTSETTKCYPTDRRPNPRSGPCTPRRGLPRCNTERTWRRGRTGTVAAGVALPRISSLRPSRSCHPLIDHQSDEPQNITSNLLHQRLCVRIRPGAITNLNSALRLLGANPLITSRRTISTGATSTLDRIAASHCTRPWLPSRQTYRTRRS